MLKRLAFLFTLVLINLSAKALDTLYYNEKNELTISSFASTIRIAEIDRQTFKFTGLVVDYSIDGTKILELNYNSLGQRHGRITSWENKVIMGTYENGTLRKGLLSIEMKDNIQDTSRLRVLPKELEKELLDKEKLIASTFIRKNDHPEIEPLLTKKFINILIKNMGPQKVPVKIYTSSANQNDSLEEVFTMVEKPAFFFGGNDFLQTFLRAGVEKYFIEHQIDKRWAGKIYVRCRIQKNGAVSHISIHSGSNTELDKAVIYSFGMLPDWHPAFQNGSPVNFSTVLMVNIE